MKLIVVEGCDGSGKSTLIENLRYATKRYFSIVKPTGPPRTTQNLRAFIDWMHLTYLDCEIPVILDRHPFISEPIYGLTLRNDNLVEQVYTSDVVKAILRRSIDRIIYCRPADSIIKESFRGRQLEGVASRLPEIIEMYDRVMVSMSRCGIPVLYYDWTKNLSSEIENLFFGVLPNGR